VKGELKRQGERANDNSFNDSKPTNGNATVNKELDVIIMDCIRRTAEKGNPPTATDIV
jgi:hypothetical protein